MIITGGFLADAAAAVDGLLHVWGGVVTFVTVSPDRHAQLTLVVLTQLDSGSLDRRVQVELVPPPGGNGQNTILDWEVPEVATASEIGFAYWQFVAQYPVDGRYVFMVSGVGDDSAVSIPLLVRSAPMG